MIDPDTLVALAILAGSVALVMLTPAPTRRRWIEAWTRY